MSGKEEELCFEGTIIASMCYLYLESLRSDSPEFARIIERATDELRFVSGCEVTAADVKVDELSGKGI